MILRSVATLLVATTLQIAMLGPIFGQSYPVTSIIISMPANPDANTVNWGAGASLLTISATAASGPVAGRTDPAVAGSRVLVGIRQGNRKICGTYTGASAPASNFSTPSKVWSGDAAKSLLGKDCVLPAGDYELYVQVFSGKADASVPASREVAKAFTIRGNEQQRTR